jgi:hypothetical protein
MQKGSIGLTIGAMLKMNDIKYDWSAVKGIAAAVVSACVGLAAYSDSLPANVNHWIKQIAIGAGVVGTIAGALAAAQSLPPLVVPNSSDEPEAEFHK